MTVLAAPYGKTLVRCQQYDNLTTVAGLGRVLAQPDKSPEKSPPGDSEPATTPKSKRKRGLRKRLIVISGVIGAIFAIPIAVKTGLDGIGAWEPLKDAFVNVFLKTQNEDLAEHSLVEYFEYKKSTLANVGTVIPGLIAKSARDPNRRYSIGCTADGYEIASNSFDGIALVTKREEYIREKLIAAGVSPSQILPGWDDIPEAIHEGRTKEPLNRRCVIKSDVAENPNWAVRKLESLLRKVSKTLKKLTATHGSASPK